MRDRGSRAPRAPRATPRERAPRARRARPDTCARCDPPRSAPHTCRMHPSARRSRSRRGRAARFRWRASRARSTSPPCPSRTTRRSRRRRASTPLRSRARLRRPSRPLRSVSRRWPSRSTTASRRRQRPASLRARRAAWIAASPFRAAIPRAIGKPAAPSTTRATLLSIAMALASTSDPTYGIEAPRADPEALHPPRTRHARPETPRRSARFEMLGDVRVELDAHDVVLRFSERARHPGRRRAAHLGLRRRATLNDGDFHSFFFEKSMSSMPSRCDVSKMRWSR